MEWLAQNWLWLVFGIAMLLVMRRGGHGGGGGCCGGGGHGHGADDKRRPTDAGAAANAPADGRADHHH